MRLSARRWAVAGAAVLVLGVTFGAMHARQRPVRYATAAATRGDVAEVVGATGTLQAVTTVQVGSQVSGTIQILNADFNSVVHKGQVIARLDPSSFEARVGQARANLVSARANVERTRAAVEDTRQKYERAKELAAEKLLPQSDLETAKANYEGAVAQVKAAEAAVSQAAAALNQAQVDLDHTVITAPIDGVVIGRNVDVGQTVAASFQAPVLFTIANDLSRMQVNASVDEADIGRVQPGEEVSFRVDAFPEQTFEGRVEQVRLQPTTVQNVVTYNAIISVDNPGQKLKPGMTATVSIIVRRADNVLRIPATALRFRPEGFDASSLRRTESASPQAAEGGSPPASAPPAAAQGQGPGGMGGFRRGGGAGGAGGGAGFRRGQGGGAPPTDEQRAAWMARREQRAAAAGGGSGGIVFTLDDKGEPQPARVRLGISDGQFVEVRDGLKEGDKVVIGTDGDTARPAPRASGSPGAANPFQPQIQRPRR
jgi:HlyD family secretion protein